MQNIIMAEADSDTKGGGAPESKEEPKKDLPKDDTKSKEEGDIEYDDLGYAKPKDDKTPESKKEPKKDESKKEPDATGYEKEPPKEKEEDSTGYSEDDDKDEAGDDDKKPKEDPEDLKLDTGDLVEDEIKQIKEFAKKHKITKEVAQALVDAKKAEVQSLKAEMKKHEKLQQAKIIETKRGWRKELMEDSTFGGENFDKNILKANKVVQEFLPNTKKMLTEKGSMLPPYVMRDLVKLADHLYATENMVAGDPSVPKKTENETEDPLDFYNS